MLEIIAELMFNGITFRANLDCCCSCSHALLINLITDNFILVSTSINLDNEITFIIIIETKSKQEMDKFLNDHPRYNSILHMFSQN